MNMKQRILNLLERYEDKKAYSTNHGKQVYLDDYSFAI